MTEDEKRTRMIEVLSMIEEDMERDVKDFDGKPFTGLTVGTHYGYACAAIVSLAKIIKEVIKDAIPVKGI